MSSIYHFVDKNINNALVSPQIASDCFGPLSSDAFRTTSSFQINSDVPAYAMLKGYVLVQSQNGNGTGNPGGLVNIILRPFQQPQGFFPIKYIIYRGLKRDDFIDSNTGNVLTTGSEFINALQIIQQKRQPGAKVPTSALFGEYQMPTTGIKPHHYYLDNYFFIANNTGSQLFMAESGMHLGNFKANELAGVDIVLENPEYYPTIDMSREIFFVLLANATNSSEKAYQYEQSRHFVDVAAFYGLLADQIFRGESSTKLYYRNLGVTQEVKTTNDVYNNLLVPFFSKHRIYIDIRNENGNSYNYYGNYKGNTGNAAEDEKELKIGVNPLQANLKEYYTEGWPVHIFEYPTPHTTKTSNSLYISLRLTSDNKNPMLVGQHLKITTSPSKVDRQTTFVTENDLVDANDPVWTKPLGCRVPNAPGTPSGKQLTTLIKLNYAKQREVGNTLGTTKFPYEHYTDYLFGPVNTFIPWNSSDGVQWISSHHHKYVDGLSIGIIESEAEVQIDATVQFPSKQTIDFGQFLVGDIDEIEILSSIRPDLSGLYKVKSMHSNGITTMVVLQDVLPDIELLRSHSTLIFKLKSLANVDYKNKKIVALGIDLSNNVAFKPSPASTPTALAQKIWLHNITNQGHKVRYTLDSRVFDGKNTIFTTRENITLSKRRNIGFGGWMETGMVLENDFNSSPSGDIDRVILYAAPQSYFSNINGNKRTFFNYAGGTFNNKSFFQTIQKINKDFQVEKLSIQEAPGNYIFTLAYRKPSVVKENIFLLGLDRDNWQNLQISAKNLLHQYHLFMCRLIPSGGLKKDVNNQPYYKYELVLYGLEKSSNTYTNVHPNTPIVVYSRDGLIFTTPEFANKEEQALGQAKLTYEELFHLTTTPPPGDFEYGKQHNGANSTYKYLYTNIGAPLKVIVNGFKTKLDTLTPVNFANKIEKIIRDEAAKLLNKAREQIRLATSAMYNKDGALYLARLQMRKTLKQHPLVQSLINKGTLSIDDMERCIDLIEKVSRGLHRDTLPNFTTYPNHIPILITGYDPFRSIYRSSFRRGWGKYNGLDGQYHLSNPSGNIALALHNTELVNGSKKAKILTSIFPVRYDDFNNGIVESYFQRYIDQNHLEHKSYVNFVTHPLKIIVTVSYGFVNAHKTSSRFHLDRFASRHRNPTLHDNEFKLAGKSYYLSQKDKDDKEFIENSLGELAVTNDFKPWLDSTKKFKLAQNYKFAIRGADSSGKIIIDDNSGSNYIGSNLVNDGSTLESFPDIVNYPSNIYATSINSNRELLSRNGSGGSYLSNEIHYRVAFLREKFNKSNLHQVRTGHIHVGFLYDNVDTDRKKMIADIVDTLQNKILPLL
ncbi:hypothetical protein [uncultured Microscilla sp.]|uniref:hypothetical protein n=1 Tax=uncultured Microscilla sp. TaxID=432653 RepID=UPI00261CAB76|nr:hypothetical protein [uncultured Microscilla sp.]